MTIWVVDYSPPPYTLFGGRFTTVRLLCYILTYHVYVQDYPSVGQILDLLHEYDVTAIFAIRQNHVASYEVTIAVGITQCIMKFYYHACVPTRNSCAKKNPQAICVSSRTRMRSVDDL